VLHFHHRRERSFISTMPDDPGHPDGPPEIVVGLVSMVLVDDFVSEDNWLGSYYELAIQIGRQGDDTADELVSP
jgi:hypothetical protein